MRSNSAQGGRQGPTDAHAIFDHSLYSPYLTDCRQIHAPTTKIGAWVRLCNIGRCFLLSPLCYNHWELPLTVHKHSGRGERTTRTFLFLLFFIISFSFSSSSLSCFYILLLPSAAKASMAGSQRIEVNYAFFVYCLWNMKPNKRLGKLPPS